MNKILIPENEYELAEIMLDAAEEAECGVACIAHYEYIRDLLQALILTEEVVIANITLEEPDLDDYNKEFVLTVDTEGYIWIEKAYSDYIKDYLWIEDDVIFLHNDCNSRIISKVDNEDALVICYEYNGELECDGDCEHCELAEEETDLCECDEDDEMHGFSLHKETANGSVFYSFHSTDPNMVERMRRELLK